VFHAAVAGGDERAVEVREVLERAGVKLLPHNHNGRSYEPRETMALGAARTLVGRRGPRRAAEVLTALARADLAPITADHVKVGEALLCDPDYADAFDAERLTAAMRAVTPAILKEAREQAAALRLPAWRALTAIVYRRAPKPPRAKVAAPAVPPTSPAVAEPIPSAPARERLGTRVKPPPGVRTFAALAHIVMPSPALAAVVGAGPLLRTDAVSALWRYINAHDLLDRVDRRVVVADAKLRAAIGRDRALVSELDSLLAARLRAA